MIEIINKPWENKFLQYVFETKNSIKICSPFVKYKVLKKIFKYKSKKVNFDLITNFNIAHFYKRASDLEAMRYILEKNGRIKNYQNLHAKIYIFDERSVVITSANLTNSGLTKNYEYGILSDEPNLVKKVCEDFDLIYQSELSGEITNEIIETIDRILNNIPQEKKIKLPEINLIGFQDEEVYQDDLFTGGIESIKKSLSGWKLAIFNQLNKINKFVFELSDVYKYKPDLQKIYPENHNIEAKIRQQLQFLRDMGLIKFLGKGRYKKLWI
ncbi:MAG: hypothetical protein PWQ82_719 [Thermosediminibacterales bacterium]|nr:hypothetical protein [Thermosediminibacterales bacterium]MDK2836923.1 hypothetical protein [Thermosediminibacterales bacterium]